MGAKTKVNQAPTVTPEQKALLDAQMRGVYNAMQGFNLGAGWAGPSFGSYDPQAGYGGMRFDMTSGGAPLPQPKIPPHIQAMRGMMAARPQQSAPAQANPMMAALQSVARIPGAPGQVGGAPGVVNPTSAAAYSNRENLVSPVVNPFRRNLGG
jgi:hypothetical protein